MVRYPRSKTSKRRTATPDGDGRCHKTKSYYQVSYLLASEETRNREIRSLMLIDDQFPKYILSLDRIDFSEQGIKHINIIDFLNQKTK